MDGVFDYYANLLSHFFLLILNYSYYFVTFDFLFSRNTSYFFVINFIIFIRKKGEVSGILGGVSVTLVRVIASVKIGGVHVKVLITYADEQSFVYVVSVVEGGIADIQEERLLRVIIGKKQDHYVRVYGHFLLGYRMGVKVKNNLKLWDEMHVNFFAKKVLGDFIKH